MVSYIGVEAEAVVANALSDRQRNALRKAKRAVASRPEIRGVDIGYVYREGKPLKRMGIRFHVTRKKSVTDLTSDEFLPKEIDGIACDVLEASYMPHATVDPLGKVDPVRPGISIGNVERTIAAGSLGALVRDQDAGKVAILSNWHVLAASPNAAIGEAITQPAAMFLGPNPARPVAKLGRWLDIANGWDAAIALVGDGIDWEPDAANMEQRFTETTEPQLGMRLLKSGSISGVTAAIVDGIEGSFPINYTKFGLATQWMKGIRLVQDPEDPYDEVSLSGDSGAVWFDRDSGKAVALHFGGEDHLTPLYEYALAHPIVPVLEALRIELA